LQDIKKYEAMAKLDLPENERQWISGCVNVLVESFNELQKIDTSGVQPLVTALNIQNVFREDTCAKMLSREELLSNAPEQYDCYFQAPKTLG